VLLQCLSAIYDLLRYFRSINISFCCYEGKGDGTDAESGPQEDFLIQDEIFKSRLVSIKHASHSLSPCCILQVLFYGLFHFFYVACNSWWLYAVTVGGIEKKVRLTLGIWSIVLLG